MSTGEFKSKSKTVQLRAVRSPQAHGKIQEQINSRVEAVIYTMHEINIISSLYKHHLTPSLLKMLIPNIIIRAS